MRLGCLGLGLRTAISASFLQRSRCVAVSSRVSSISGNRLRKSSSRGSSTAVKKVSTAVMRTGPEVSTA